MVMREGNIKKVYIKDNKAKAFNDGERRGKTRPRKDLYETKSIHKCCMQTQRRGKDKQTSAICIDGKEGANHQKKAATFGNTDLLCSWVSIFGCFLCNLVSLSLMVITICTIWLGSGERSPAVVGSSIPMPQHLHCIKLDSWWRDGWVIWSWDLSGRE